MFKKTLIYIIVLMSLSAMAFMTDMEVGKESIPNNINVYKPYDPIVVLELFTSQGCSSCPPADALLDKVKDKNNVYALSYHVDYWNYIGWEDPFGKAEFADKQRKYNIKLRNRSNYTPQMVVNGKEHFVGSNSALVNKSIVTYGKQKPANRAEVKNLAKNSERITFDYRVLGNIQGKQTRAVLVIGQKTTLVKRGENRNRTLVNSNIVVAEKSIPIVAALRSDFIKIPELVNINDTLELVLLVENKDYDITGATKAKLVRH